MIENRMKIFNKRYPAAGKYALYWMQASQRIDYNFTLSTAVSMANYLNQPLIVLFCVLPFPGAVKAHYQFLFEGISKVKEKFNKMRIPFIMKRTDNPIQTVIEFTENASMLFMDFGYLPIQRHWRNEIIQRIEKRVYIIEDNLCVPIETVSLKEEYSAATLRRKIWKYVPEYLYSFSIPELKFSIDEFDDTDLTINDLEFYDPYEYPVKKFQGGEKEAQSRLKEFVENKLKFYSEKSNNPAEEFVSHLSPYLHFGQISPVSIVWEVLKYKEEYPASVSSFLEELIVRRELAYNFVYYQKEFDHPICLHKWALNSLKEHEKDPRPYLYHYEELEKGETHDIYWNAAQKEMIYTGKMNGYMRMYWGKKIIEWTSDIETAWKWMIKLNDRYELDGRDANGYTGIAWIFGKHDRPWKERDIFGKVRYMNARGLERKFPIQEYVNKINHLTTRIIK